MRGEGNECLLTAGHGGCCCAIIVLLLTVRTVGGGGDGVTDLDGVQVVGLAAWVRRKAQRRVRHQRQAC